MERVLELYFRKKNQMILKVQEKLIKIIKVINKIYNEKIKNEKLRNWILKMFIYLNEKLYIILVLFLIIIIIWYNIKIKDSWLLLFNRFLLFLLIIFLIWIYKLILEFMIKKKLFIIEIINNHKFLKNISLFILKWSNLYYIYNDYLILIIKIMRKIRKYVKNKKIENIILIIVKFLKKIKLYIIREEIIKIIKRRFIFWLLITLILLIFGLKNIIIKIIILFYMMKLIDNILKDWNEKILRESYESYKYSYKKIKERKGEYDEMLESIYILKDIEMEEDIEIEKYRWIATSKIVDNKKEKGLKIYNENIYWNQEELYYEEREREIEKWKIMYIVYWLEICILSIVELKEKIEKEEIVDGGYGIYEKVKKKIEKEEEEKIKKIIEEYKKIIEEYKKIIEEYKKIIEEYKKIGSIIEKIGNIIEKIGKVKYIYLNVGLNRENIEFMDEDGKESWKKKMKKMIKFEIKIKREEKLKEEEKKKINEIYKRIYEKIKKIRKKEKKEIKKEWVERKKEVILDILKEEKDKNNLYTKVIIKSIHRIPNIKTDKVIKNIKEIIRKMEPEIKIEGKEYTIIVDGYLWRTLKIIDELTRSRSGVWETKEERERKLKLYKRNRKKWNEKDKKEVKEIHKRASKRWMKDRKMKKEKWIKRMKWKIEKIIWKIKNK